MQIPNKREVVAVAIGLATVFALGRYSVQQPPAIKLTESVKTDTKTQEAKDTHTHTQTKIVEVQKPTGEKITTTTIDTVANDEKIVAKDTTEHLQETVTPVVRSKINVSALVGTQIGSNFGQPVYGVSASKELIGPITVGAFGLTNGMIGVSLGLDF